MAEISVQKIERKGSILTRPSLPCLSDYATINLAAGCPYGCRYCYAQSFHNYPGRQTVKVYANTLSKLRQELPRKRKPPVMVYFSTGCEPFMPIDAVLADLFEIMRLLLERRIKLLISTKSRIPKRFIALFREHREDVHIQVGITTLNDTIRQQLEPRAAKVSERLAGIQDCVSTGLTVEARMDPLIPELTDTDDSLRPLMQKLSDIGLTHTVASHLFLRRKLFEQMNLSIGPWRFVDVRRRLYSEHIDHYCGGGQVNVLSLNYRKERASSLMNLAQSIGIACRFCSCKNPDFATTCCHPQPDPTATPQARLL